MIDISVSETEFKIIQRLINYKKYFRGSIRYTEKSSDKKKKEEKKYSSKNGWLFAREITNSIKKLGYVGDEKEMKEKEIAEIILLSKHRSDYLNKKLGKEVDNKSKFLIEKAPKKVKTVDKKGRLRSELGKQVYRLKKDSETMKKLLIIYQKRGLFKHFTESDYYTNNITAAGMLFMDFLIFTTIDKDTSETVQALLQSKNRIIVPSSLSKDFVSHLQKLVFCSPNEFVLFLKDDKRFKDAVLRFNNFLKDEKLTRENMSSTNLLALSLLVHSYFDTLISNADKKDSLKGQEDLIKKWYPIVMTNLTPKDLSYFKKYVKNKKEARKK